MKKIYLVLFCLIFWIIFCSSAFRVWGVKKNEHVFSDAGYQTATHNFFPNQTIYVRVEFAASGDLKQVLKILDAQKNEVRRISLERQGSGPFIYTAAFSSPNEPGVYYLDIRIENGQGSVFASQENINVGESESNSVAVSEVHSQVNSGVTLTATRMPKITPTGKPAIISTPTPEITPFITSTPEQAVKPSWVKRMINFWRSLILRLTNR